MTVELSVLMERLFRRAVPDAGTDRKELARGISMTNKLIRQTYAI